MNKIKYKLVLLRRENSVLSIVKVLSLKTIDSLIRFQNKTYSLNIKQPTYIQNQNRFFFMNIDTNIQLFLNDSNENSEKTLNPDELDTLVSNKFIRELSNSVTENLKDKIINIVLGAIFGALVSAIILMQYYQSKIQEIYDTLVIGGF